jgi:hypothetical protein
LPKLHEKTQSETSPDSSISSNRSSVKQNSKCQEELQQRRLPSTVSNSHRKQCEKTALTTQPSVTSVGQKGYYEGSSSLTFRAGFRECAREARDALRRFDDIDPAVCERLSSHLLSCIDSVENGRHEIVDSTKNTKPGDARVLASSVLIQTPTGLALMPTKLPNGDLAFIIPAYIKSSLTSCQNNENAQNCPLNYELGESRHLQEGAVWRPW